MLLAKSLNELRALEARLESAKAVYRGDYAAAWQAAAFEALHDGRAFQAAKASQLREFRPVNRKGL